MVNLSVNAIKAPSGKSLVEIGLILLISFLSPFLFGGIDENYWVHFLRPDKTLKCVLSNNLAKEPVRIGCKDSHLLCRDCQENYQASTASRGRWAIPMGRHKSQNEVIYRCLTCENNLPSGTINT